MKTLLLIITIVSNFPVIIVGVGAILLLIFIFLVCRNRQRKVRRVSLLQGLVYKLLETALLHLYDLRKHSVLSRHRISLTSCVSRLMFCIMSLNWHVMHLLYIGII